ERRFELGWRRRAGPALQAHVDDVRALVDRALNPRSDSGTWRLQLREGVDRYQARSLADPRDAVAIAARGRDDARHGGGVKPGRACTRRGTAVVVGAFACSVPVRGRVRLGPRMRELLVLEVDTHVDHCHGEVSLAWLQGLEPHAPPPGGVARLQWIRGTKR